jgi:hypothetical protein
MSSLRPLVMEDAKRLIVVMLRLEGTTLSTSEIEKRLPPEVLRELDYHPSRHTVRDLLGNLWVNNKIRRDWAGFPEEEDRWYVWYV